jgi:ribulose-5-phosphate 4-epimerase/fuculose-1-phosphate aldolase
MSVLSANESASILASERADRKARLAVAFRVFAHLGFDLGVAGHITARDPELTDHFWVNPLARHFSQIRVSNLVLVAHDGTIVDGKGPINHSAFVIHSRIHAARPDVISVAHAHSVHGVAIASLGCNLRPINQNACAFFEDCVLFDEYSGPVLALEEGERIAQTLGNAKATILRNHGLLTVGRSVDEAAWWFIALERACQVQLLASAAGALVDIDAHVARVARDVGGTHEAGHLGFQPLYQWMSEHQPDVFD